MEKEERAERPKKQRKMPRFCGRYTVHGQPQGMEGVRRHVRLGCSLWRCPYCGPRKLKRLKRGIAAQAELLGLTRMLTLTLAHDMDPGESFTHIKGCWRKMRVYLQRKTGESIRFIAFVEPQKSGHAHLHILVDRYLEQAWVKQAWQAVGGGRIVDIRRLADMRRAAAYLAKYLTKDCLEDALPKGTRRYSTSKGIKLLEKASKGVWELLKVPLELLRDRASEVVAEYFDPETGLFISFDTPARLEAG